MSKEYIIITILSIVILYLVVTKDVSTPPKRRRRLTQKKSERAPSKKIEEIIVERVPINISTRPPAVETYQQIGILTGHGLILPLWGKYVYRGSQNLRYYTMSDQYHNMRLEIVHKGRDCMDSQGCPEIFDGDTVFVKGYNKNFSAEIYEKPGLRYIPYIV